jgi:hypothetical protein
MTDINTNTDVWYNFAETFNKDISDEEYITQAELDPNYLIAGQLAYTDDVFMHDIREDAAGEIYGVISKGDGNGGLQGLYGTPGGSLTFIDIGIGTAIDGKTIQHYGNNSRHFGAAIYKISDNNYALFVMEDNAGLSRPMRFDSNNKMVSWTFTEYLTDNTDRGHTDLQINENADESTNVIAACTRMNLAEDGGEGLVIYNVV